MSALSTPGGGGTTAQNKPTAGKQKYQKLDINSLYCANKNENSEPSSVKSQLSRKHGMQSLGKVPSARRPPANLPSLKTETGQDSNANSVSATSTTVSTVTTCTSQTTTTTSSSAVVAGSNAGGWVSLPPPSSPHFRTEFPSLESAAQPSHRSTDHSQPQLSLRPQTEGSWTCGGSVAGRTEPAPAPSPAPASQQTQTFRAILPPFLMKGSSGSGLGLGALGGRLRERERGVAGGAGGGSRAAPGAPRAAQPPRARPAPARPADLLTSRPILRDDQISSLDDIAHDAGWAQNDDNIDYDQKLDFSDGESTAPPVKPVKSSSNASSSNRASIENERVDSKMQEPGDEDQLWAVRRQKQNEIAQAVARAKQLKEEEQRRQMRDTGSTKDNRDEKREDRDRNDNRERDYDSREKDRVDMRDRERDRDRMDRDKDRNDRDKDRGDVRDRDVRDKDRSDNRDRDRFDRFDNRDRERTDRDRVPDNRARVDTRDRLDSEKDRNDNRDRYERDRGERDRGERERDRGERDRAERDRGERDRDFRDRDYQRNRDRDYGRERDKASYQPQIAPRFLKQQQQNRQQEDHKNWAFGGKPAPRKQEPPPYNAPPRHPPHNGRQSYSRDVSDREDDFRRERDGPGPQWRSEMQDYDRPRELDRSNSKDSYKDYDYKDKRDSDHRKEPVEHNRTAADKLSEVFERKSIGLVEPFASSEPVAAERRITPPANISRDSSERDFGKTSWAEVAQEDSSYNAHKSSSEKSLQPKINNEPAPPKEISPPKDIKKDEIKPAQAAIVVPIQQPPPTTSAPQQQKYQNNHASSQQYHHNQITHSNSQGNLQSQTPSLNQSSFSDTQTSIVKSTNQQLPPKSTNQNEQSQKQIFSEPVQQNVVKPVQVVQRVDKEFSETEPVVSKTNVDSTAALKIKEITSVDSLTGSEAQSRTAEDKKNERPTVDHANKNKETVERKSSGSGSEKKGRGYAGGAGYGVVYNNRGWGRDGRGRRAPRRASDSDASTDAAPAAERRRRGPRSPRAPRHKPDERAPDAPAADPAETREPFAPRGQPSRRGRGGFHGTARPPAPAKRLAGYGPPHTKSPFSQASRAVRDDDAKEPDDKPRGKPRTGSSAGRARRPRAPHDEDDNWETTSEHSEGGSRRRVPRARPAAARPRPARPDAAAPDTLPSAAAAASDDLVDDGFQEVRNRKTSKDARGPSKEENQKQPRSHSNQGGSRTQSSSRNSNEKVGARGAAAAVGKPGPQYDRARQQNLAPRFVKQRQKQQLGLSSFGPDTSAAPPPPAVNAWDKPLRAAADEPEPEPRPADATAEPAVPAPLPAAALAPAPASAHAPPPAPAPAHVTPPGVLDGATPPVETIIFENTNYKTAPPVDALKQKYQPNANTAKPQTEESPSEMEARPLQFNGEVRPRPRSIQELIGDNGRPVPDGDTALGLQMSFEASQKAEDSSDMKLDFAFDSDLGQLTEDKSAKSLGLPRGTHMSTSNTISPLAADLNLKIASVKKVWEMPAVAEGGEELQFAAFEENNSEAGAPPNVCKVKPTQQLQSPPPQHYNHVSYQGGYGGLSVPSPPAVLFNSTQPLLGSSQQLPQQGGLYGAFLDQSRGQFGGFPGSPYAAQSASPYNFPPGPDIFPSLQSQYRMAAAAAGGGAAFGQSGQLGNNPSTVLISSTSNSLMSANVKPTTQQIGAIGSKGNVGGVGGVGGVNTYQQQYMGYSTPVGEAAFSMPGLLPRAAPPASSYYSAYQGPGGPAQYPLQFQQQQSAFGSQYLSQVAAAAVQQQMQQQYRAPMQQQYAAPVSRGPQQQLKSPLHEHANGFAQLCDAGSPTPKPKKPPHSPPHHKYMAPPPAHTPHHHAPHPHHQHQQQQQHHQQHQQHQQQQGARTAAGGRAAAPRYPAPIQRPPAPAPPYRAPQHHARHHRPMYYHPPPSNGSGGGERAEAEAAAEAEAGAGSEPAPADVKAD